MKFRVQHADPAGDAKLGELTAIVFDPEEDLTIQSYRDDADINVVMQRFGVTGELPVSRVEPFYGDFSEAVDYQTALNMVLEADDAFDALPAKVRDRFGNSPIELMKFVADEKNRDEAEELGLVMKRPPEEEPVVPRLPLKDKPAKEPAKEPAKDAEEA